jgi:hypothetical protein
MSNYSDTLMEMLLPVELWGCDYFTVPFYNKNNSGDIIRILASEDDTQVSIDKTSKGTLGRGEYIELDSPDTLSDLWIHSNKPVQVTQYSKSWEVAGVGDPSEMVIIPSNLFFQRYTFYSPAWTNLSEGSYVIIIVPYMPTNVWLDGSLIQNADWGGGYFGQYVTLPVSEGKQHTVEADNPIGVYSYGYEKAGSYAYPAGESPPPPAQPVGGIAFPANKLALLAPYIILAALIAIGTVSVAVYWRRQGGKK